MTVDSVYYKQTTGFVLPDRLLYLSRRRYTTKTQNAPFCS
jgi:hypothetical protein